MKQFTLFFLSLFLSTVLSQVHAGESSTLSTISIYWDASASMQNRDITKDKQFLKSYLEQQDNGTFTFTVFSNSIIYTNEFNINAYNWEELSGIIDTIDYDGSSCYSCIDFNKAIKATLLFTDANFTYSKIKLGNKTPLIIVDSSSETRNAYADNIAQTSGGAYLNLKIESVTTGLTKTTALRSSAFNPNISKDKNGTIEGIVLYSKGELADVNVLNKTSGNGSKTNSKGQYAIQASVGDTLSYSYIGFTTKEIILESITPLNIQLFEDRSNLKEVVITKQKEEDYLIKTAHGEINQNGLGYSTQTVGSEWIYAPETDIGQVIGEKFSNVTMGNNNDISQAVIRGLQSIQLSSEPLFILDGAPVALSSTPKGTVVTKVLGLGFIDTQNIKNITVLSSTAATNRYGAAGRNGVVLIESKSGDLSFVDSPEEKKKGRKIKTFTGNLEVMNIQGKSNYEKRFETLNTSTEALAFYNNQKAKNPKNINLYIAASEYFFDASEPERATRILSNIAEVYPNEIAALRLLAFQLEYHESYNEAVRVHEGIVDVLPSMAQSYLDLARAYAKAGNHQQSVDTYNAIIRNRVNANVNFDGILEQAKNDFKKLLFYRKQHWDLKRVDKKYFKNNPLSGRVVVEWNSPDAEFELELVQPNREIIELPHTKERNEWMILQEITEGVASFEYPIKFEPKGEWFVNLIPSVKTDKTEVPRVLRITVYENFSTSTETSKTILVNLDDFNKESVIASFMVD